MARQMSLALPATVIPGRLADVLADQRARVAAGLIVGAFAGLVSSFVAPRGPTTTLNALFIMAISLGVGVTAGSLVRSRWILVPLFLADIAGVELGRLGLAAPTLALRFDNAFGIIAFVLTRGVHGFLVLLPLGLGVLLGIALARYLGRVPGTGHRRVPIGTGLLTVLTVGLAGIVALPASTPPVLGVDGRPVQGSIAELATVRLGGQDQAVMIRAAHPDDPVLLWLAGGPGQSDLALTRVQTAGWAQHFVVAALDQRGNGKSYAAIDPASSMTLQTAVSDVIEVTQYLRQRFGEQKIYLMGESWGTILGVLAVQQRPELYYAWIPSGQMVDVLETDRRVYRDLVAYGQREGDSALLAKLQAIGQPPYRDIPWANSNLLAWYDYLYPPYTPADGYTARGDASGLDPFGMLGSEYNLVEKTNVLRGLLDTFTVMYPQLYDLDFRQTAERLDVPVYFLDGTSELAARRDLALEWFNRLQAPTKQLVRLDGAAHAVAFEQADKVQALLTDVVVPATYGK